MEDKSIIFEDKKYSNTFNAKIYSSWLISSNFIDLFRQNISHSNFFCYDPNMDCEGNELYCSSEEFSINNKEVDDSGDMKKSLKTLKVKSIFNSISSEDINPEDIYLSKNAVLNLNKNHSLNKRWKLSKSK